MKTTKQRVFHYHADANAIGGTLKQPYQQMITAPTSVSLSGAGGYSTARTAGFGIDHIVSTTTSYTHVAGTDETGAGPWTTLVTAVVEGLNIMEVVTADRIVAQLSARHPQEGYVPTVAITGSQFVNLRVNGVPVEAEVNLDVLNVQQEPGKPAICLSRHPEMLRRAADHCNRMTNAPGAPDWLAYRYGWLASGQVSEERGYLLCSLVNQVTVQKPNMSFGHVVHVPDFGDLILGELIFDQGTYRLTMLRAEMGCIGDGTITVSTAHTNGLGAP